MASTEPPDGDVTAGAGRTPVRYLASGDEAGSAPEDRPFRPDVEGLRAVAVLLVVLYHVGLAGFGGGYVGVDVFFVISGYVITGLLLRGTCLDRPDQPGGVLRAPVPPHHPRRRPRHRGHRARHPRARRPERGQQVASDARWASVFLANFHFTATGTNYFLAQRPPSPLQSYWSLAVEEQFYVVYPTLFLIVAAVGRKILFGPAWACSSPWQPPCRSPGR